MSYYTATDSELGKKKWQVRPSGELKKALFYYELLFAV
jgi:hypothetical protein